MKRLLNGHPPSRFDLDGRSIEHHQLTVKHNGQAFLIQNLNFEVCRDGALILLSLENKDALESPELIVLTIRTFWSQ
jgi:hypothetical protein